MYKTEIQKLDELIGGGLPEGEIVSIFGEPDSGKSLLAYQIASQYNSIYISTEVGNFDAFAVFLKKRFGKKFKEPKVLTVRSFTLFCAMFGLEASLDISGGGKTTVQFKPCVPRLSEYLNDDTEILVLDSFSLPLQNVFGGDQQDFPARAKTIARLFDRFADIQERHPKLTIILIHHESKNKANKYDKGTIWGGNALLHRTKFNLQMTKVNQKHGKYEMKKIRRRRFFGKMEEEGYETLKVKEDYGYE